MDLLRIDLTIVLITITAIAFVWALAAWPAFLAKVKDYHRYVGRHAPHPKHAVATHYLRIVGPYAPGS